MTRAEESKADAVIEVDGLSFQAWMSRRGVTRVILPKLVGGPRGRRADGRRIRINIKEGMGPECEALAAELAVFLKCTLDGAPGISPAVDLEGLSLFTREVLEVVASIPWGRTCSYGWVADRVDKPGASRAVGGAVSRNPVPLLVPCHRVVRADGSPGGWSGAPGWKEHLLAQEAK